MHILNLFVFLGSQSVKHCNGVGPFLDTLQSSAGLSYSRPAFEARFSWSIISGMNLICIFMMVCVIWPLGENKDGRWKHGLQGDGEMKMLPCAKFRLRIRTKWKVAINFSPNQRKLSIFLTNKEEKVMHVQILDNNWIQVSITHPEDVHRSLTLSWLRLLHYWDAIFRLRRNNEDVN